MRQSVSPVTLGVSERRPRRATRAPHGWVSLSVEPDAGEERWTQIAEWVRTSYTLVAPKKLARLVLIEDGLE